MKPTILASVLALALMTGAHARPACDFNPSVSCYETQKTERTFQQKKRHAHRAHNNVRAERKPDPQKTEEARKPEEPRRGGLAAIQCGPRQISVARGARVQFEGFCRDLYQVWKFRAVGGWRRGKCWTGGKHPCGGAIDVGQWGRSHGPGHLQQPDYPTVTANLLADRWGLTSGCRWENKDCGHFESKGALAGNNWPENKLAQVALAVASKLKPEDAPPPHPLLGAGYQMASVQSDDFLRPIPEDFSPIDLPDHRVMTPVAYELLNEYTPRGYRPVDRLVQMLRAVPRGSAREEIMRASAISGVPYRRLMSFAKIESDFDCGNKTGSYKGLFQLSDYEFKRYGGGDIWNCRDNALASVIKFITEAEMFRHVSGHEPSDFWAYMIHQQGWEGAAEHAARPDRLAVESMCATGEGKEKGPGWCRRAICLNVPSDHPRKHSCASLTSQEFMDIWRKRVDRFASLDLTTETVKKPRVAEKPRKKKHRAHHRHKRHHRYAAVQ